MASSREVIKGLEANGWVLVRKSGSHHTFKHPENPLIVTLPHPEHDVSIGLLRAIKRITGITF